MEVFAGTEVLACAVIDFRTATAPPASRSSRAESAALAGAREIDMVVNTGKVKSGEWEYVKREISLINEATLAAERFSR